jgi:hypothetical protein
MTGNVESSHENHFVVIIGQQCGSERLRDKYLYRRKRT